jgi:glycerol-3-phosphate O-acyltransferase/dihydroxyacetone phosphate acyltransferase
MIYQLIRLVIFVAVKIFFRSAHIRNVENVPKTGGLLLASNHPSTFLDPLILAVWIHRPIYFLTNGGVFKNPIAAWFFKRMFMVPIYRQQDNIHDSKASKAAKNEAAFEACYKLLAKGGAIVIFPEGGSEDERRLRKLKTGLARIALGAEAKYNFDLDVKIVCAGINYTNPRQFQSEVFVQYNTPIIASHYKEQYLVNPQNTVQELTAEVEKQLSSLIVNTYDSETDGFVRQIETLYSHNLQEFLDLPSDNTEQIFTMAQHFADATQYFREQHPQKYADFKVKVNKYFSLLKKYNLPDKIVASYQNEQRNIIRNLPLLIAALPIYLLGIVHNYLPYKLPGWLALKITKDVTFVAAINFALGIIFFVGFYIFYGFFFYEILKTHFLAFLYCCLIGVAGFASYYYWHFAVRLWQKTRLYFVIHKDTSLITLRKEIIAELEQNRDAYMQTI